MPKDASAATNQLRLRAYYVYLDASIYRALQFDWQGRLLGALAELSKRGLIRVVVTEITRREVEARMREMWSEANKSMRRSAIILNQLGFADVTSALEDEQACIVKMKMAFEQWLRRCKAYTCKHAPDWSGITEDYFDGRPPFGTGKKKYEFPDAIVISMLRGWCAATSQSVYVVSQDGDLGSCCPAEGSLIFAPSVAEVVSHGTSSAEMHDAVASAITESDWFKEVMQDQVAALDVEVEDGYRHHCRIEVEVSALKLEELDLDEIIVDSFDESSMTCTVFLEVGIAVYAHLTYHGEDDWDRWSRQTTTISVPADLTATVTAERSPDGNVELVDASLDNRRISIPWRIIERAVD